MSGSTTGETEGIVALRKLQEGGFKVWTREEIEKIPHYVFRTRTKKILYYIAQQNSRQRIVSSKEIRTKFDMAESYSPYFLLKRGMGFNVTIAEIVGFFGFDYLRFSRGQSSLPKHLEWLYPYIDDERIGSPQGSRLSWVKRVKAGRPLTYERYWIALLEGEDGRPCYDALGLHIPKSQLNSI